MISEMMLVSDQNELTLWVTVNQDDDGSFNTELFPGLRFEDVTEIFKAVDAAGMVILKSTIRPTQVCVVLHQYGEDEGEDTVRGLYYDANAALKRRGELIANEGLDERDVSVIACELDYEYDELGLVGVDIS